MKFTKKTGYIFDRGDVKGFSFNTKNQFPRMSAAYFVCKGKHPKMKSINSDRLYFVIKGNGIFHMNKKIIPVHEMEIFIAPKNTPYSYEGKMECLLVHSPAFDKEKEIRYNQQ